MLFISLFAAAIVMLVGDSLMALAVLG